MKPEKLKEVKPVVTAETKQKQDVTRKCRGLKTATGARAGKYYRDSDSSNLN